VKKSAKKPVAKKAKDSSSSESEEKPKKAVVKKGKKVSSSESESDSDVKVKAPASKAVKKTSKKDDSSDSSEDLPAKRKSSATTPEPTKKTMPQESASDLKRKPEFTQSTPAQQVRTNETGETEIFVGGLSFQASEDDLWKFFEGCGEIESLKILNRDGQSRGMGFVKFITQEGVNKALALNGSQHMGRTVRINMSSDKPTGGERAPKDNSTTIFVGSLSYNSTEDTIRDFFATCGEIRGVRIGMDAEGNMRGFAHVEFASLDSVDKAVGLHGSELDGRQIKVDKAGGGSPNKGGPRGGGGFGGAQPRFGAPKDNAKAKGSIQAFQGKKMTF